MSVPSGHESLVGVVALADGSAFVAGFEAAATYPTTENAYQATSSASSNSFLTEVNPSGSDLTYSTFFGDSTAELMALALDPNGDLWVAGRTTQATFPLVNPMQDAMPVYGQPPPIVTTLSQFDPTGTMLKFSTFLGGAAASGATALAVDASHRAHVTGAASYGLYTTSGAYLANVPVPSIAYSSGVFCTWRWWTRACPLRRFASMAIPSFTGRR